MRELTAYEARVLGCLIEKERTTPDAYPLTVNSLRNACNQSTSRDPVLELTDYDVESALASLRELGLTRTVHSTSNRATKYRHVLPDVLELDESETALVAVLMLRGEQTIGELKSRTERLHGFASTDEVGTTLAALAARAEPLVQQLERKPGQKDARWVQMLTAAIAETAAAPTAPGSDADLNASTPDPYGEATAEFYDLLATAHWETFGLQLLDLLDGVDATHGPLVDLGAGTGVGLPYLRAAVPDADIFAIEPSRAMRTALHTRLALDPSLRSTVTVDPRPLADVVLPATASAIVASAVLGHLDVDERQKLWRYIQTALPAGAPAIIEMLPPDRPVVVPRTRYQSLAVGAYMYEGWQSGQPVDEHHMAWTMEYTVKSGDVEIAHDAVDGRWRCCSVTELETEIAPYGLTLQAFDDCVVVSAPG